MIDPIFQFNPNSVWTPLEMTLNGAAGSNDLESDHTPVGITRVFFQFGAFHSDGATAQILSIAIRNPQNAQTFAVPIDNNAAVQASRQVSVIRPFVVPAGYSVLVHSFTGLGAGAVLGIRGIYLDYYSVIS